MIKTRSLLVVLVVLVVLVAIGLWWVSTEVDVPSTPTVANQDRVHHVVYPAGSDESPTQRPIPKETFAKPLDDSGRPDPLSPAEEGLFAWADAAGRSVVRCARADFPEGTEHRSNTVVNGVTVSILVSASDEPGRTASTLVAGPPAYYLNIADAFVGRVGDCRVSPVKPSSPGEAAWTLQLSEAERAQLARIVNRRSAEKLADVDDVMHPIQVSLEKEGLSGGARAWLRRQLDALDEVLVEVDERPLNGADFDLYQ